MQWRAKYRILNTSCNAFSVGDGIIYKYKAYCTEKDEPWSVYSTAYIKTL